MTGLEDVEFAVRKKTTKAGHRRILIRADGGTEPACLCGWRGPVQRFASYALGAYSDHLHEEIYSKPWLCKVCGVMKPIVAMRSDYRHMCKRCGSKKGNVWSRANPERAARMKRDSHLNKKFGISIDVAEALLAKQGGVCGCCGGEISDKRGFSPHVDHDHATGMVRGILCLGCNVGLGQFKDDPVRLRAALDYLLKHERHSQ